VGASSPGSLRWGYALKSGEEGQQTSRARLAAAGRLGLAPVHKQVTKKINSDLVPLCFQIQEDKYMNKISLGVTVLPVLGSKKWVNGGCMGNALWSQVVTRKGYHLSAAHQHSGLNFSPSTDPCRGIQSSQQAQEMGQHGSTTFCDSNFWLT